MQQQKKNYTVEVFRFIFCLVIINYHFFSHVLSGIKNQPNYFARSYMGDEVFFLISGYFLMEAAMRTKKKPLQFSVSQLTKRIKKIALPYYLVWLLCFIGIHVTADIMWERYDLFNDLSNSIYELTFVEMFGFTKGYYSNAVGWFFSALLIFTFLLSPFAAKYKEKFSLYIAPVISLFCYGALSINFEYLYFPHARFPLTIFLRGQARALASISLGVCVHGIVNHEGFKKAIQSSRTVRNWIRVIGAIFWLLIFDYVNYPFESNASKPKIQFDLICAIGMGLAMIPIMAGLYGSGKRFKESEGDLVREPGSAPVVEKKSKKGNMTFGQKIATILGKYAFYAYFGQAVYYSFDRIINDEVIDIKTKFLIHHVMIFGITILLAAVNQTAIKIGKVRKNAKKNAEQVEAQPAIMTIEQPEVPVAAIVAEQPVAPVEEVPMEQPVAPVAVQIVMPVPVQPVEQSAVPEEVQYATPVVAQIPDPTYEQVAVQPKEPAI